MSIELNILEDFTNSAFSSRAPSIKTIDSELGIITPSLPFQSHYNDTNHDHDDKKEDIGRSSSSNHYLSPRSSSRRRLSLAERDAVELSKPDNSPGAYLFLINAFALEMVIWGYSFSFGIIQVYLSTHAPFESSSIEAISAVGTIALAIQYMLPAAIMQIFRRYPDKAKMILWIAMVVSCLSMLVSSWATQVWQLIILQGVLGGTAGAVLYTPVLMWMQDWFLERRGFASGIIFAGTGVGGFVFPFLLGTLLDKVGFAWTVRIWSLITLFAYAGALITLRPRLPIPKSSKNRGEFKPMDMSFLRNPTVILMCLTTLLSSLSFFPVSIYITTYTVAISSPTSANLVLAAYNAANVVGQIVVGYASDKFGYGIIITIIGLICSVTAFLSWGYADTLWKVLLFAILFGGSNGICSVWNAVSKDVSGTNIAMSSLIFCCFGISRGVASVAGPIIATSLYNPLDSAIPAAWGGYGFKNVTIFVGTMAFASALGGVALGFVKRFRKD